MLPSSLKIFIETFSRLPSLGPRAATRLAFHILHLPDGQKESITSAIQGLANLAVCPRCFFMKENDAPLCAICADKTRDDETVALVEKETDLISMEKSRAYRGKYLIIGELPPSGILEDNQKRRIEELKRDAEENKRSIKEIIVATDQTPLGDVFSETIARAFKDTGTAVTRLGRGIPTGGEVEFADPETLREALKRRF